jgi:hypothetical protein
MMASKELPEVTNVEPTRLEEVTQRERQQRLALQLALNAEVRKRWAEADLFETFQGQIALHYAALPNNLQQP